MRKNKNWIELFDEEELIKSEVLLKGQNELDLSGLGIPSKEEIKEMIDYLDVDSSNLYYFHSDITSLFYYIDEEEFIYIKIPPTSLEAMNFINAKKIVGRIIKKQAKYMDNGDYNGVFNLIETKYKIEAFLQLLNLYKHNMVLIKPEELFEIFSDVYTLSEFGFNEFNKEDFLLLFSMNTNNDYKSNIEKDGNGYVTIYRGEGEQSSPLDEAYSWTLDKDKAEWFANRYDTEEVCRVYQAKVHIDNIKAYFEDRGEEEVIVFPEDVVDVQVILEKSWC
ncbi:hypothetical protein [Tissierella pigra]|uniref:Uncharacterized protein n=1 Tax=Tissierella pigra TaxID=2607614 RepID=A0A6N7Y002_9FIRM|nr:hypothetical protein [Tissierella pigra]MSU01380.1 hypothetical protein [Tissierella pigra]